MLRFAEDRLEKRLYKPRSACHFSLYYEKNADDFSTEGGSEANSVARPLEAWSGNVRDQNM